MKRKRNWDGMMMNQLMMRIWILRKGTKRRKIVMMMVKKNRLILQGTIIARYPQKGRV